MYVTNPYKSFFWSPNPTLLLPFCQPDPSVTIFPGSPDAPEPDPPDPSPPCGPCGTSGARGGWRWLPMAEKWTIEISDLPIKTYSNHPFLWDFPASHVWLAEDNKLNMLILDEYLDEYVYVSWFLNTSFAYQHWHINFINKYENHILASRRFTWTLQNRGLPEEVNV